MAFSGMACVGDNIGRWLLLSAVTLTVVIWIYHALFILSNMDLSSGEKPSVIGFIPRAFGLVLNWWYFNRRTTVAYYKRNTSAA